MARTDKNIELREYVMQLINQEYSQSDIARHCGISRQRVSKLLKEMGVTKTDEADDINTLEKRWNRIVYPAIQEYMRNNHISMRKLCNILGEYNQPTGSVTKFLYGKVKQMPIEKINKLLETTGLTYEEVFMNKERKTK